MAEPPGDPPRSPRPYRAVVLIDDGPVPAFVAHALEGAAATPGVTVVRTLAVPAAPVPRPGRSSALFEAVERRVFRGGVDALRPAALPTTVAPTRSEGHPDRESLIRQVMTETPDVVIDLSTAILRLPPTPWGHWRLLFRARGAPGPRIQGTRPDGLAAAELTAVTPTGPHALAAVVVGLPGVGYHRRRDALYWAAAPMIARVLERTARDGLDRTLAVARPASLEPLSGDGSRTEVGRERTVKPGWRTMAGGVMNKVAASLVTEARWTVLSRVAPEDDLPTDLRGFLPVTAPAGRFFADPFVVHEDGAHRLYVEDSARGRHAGSISMLTLEGERWTDPVTVLDVGRHLSYPHVLATAGGPVVTPDDSASRSVVAYRRDDDGRLVAVTTLLEGRRASDPTLIEHGGRHWLFVTITERGMSPWDELHVFSAPVLAGPWTPHPLNPVVADARRARPAGRLFLHRGRLIRPGQDCAREYGRRIVLNEIVRLDEDDYLERPIGTIEPKGRSGVERTHCFTFDRGVQVIDAYERRPRSRVCATLYRWLLAPRRRGTGHPASDPRGG